MVNVQCVECNQPMALDIDEVEKYPKHTSGPCFELRRAEERAADYKERRYNALLAAFFGGMLVAFVPSLIGFALGLSGGIGIAAWLGVWAVAGYAIYNKDMKRTSDPDEH